MSVNNCRYTQTRRCASLWVQSGNVQWKCLLSFKKFPKTFCRNCWCGSEFSPSTRQPLRPVSLLPICPPISPCAKQKRKTLNKPKVTRRTTGECGLTLPFDTASKCCHLVSLWWCAVSMIPSVRIGVALSYNLHIQLPYNGRTAVPADKHLKAFENLSLRRYFQAHFDINRMGWEIENRKSNIIGNLLSVFCFLFLPDVLFHCQTACRMEHLDRLSKSCRLSAKSRTPGCSLVVSWNHLKSFEIIRDHLESFGIIQNRLKGFLAQKVSQISFYLLRTSNESHVIGLSGRLRVLAELLQDLSDGCLIVVPTVCCGLHFN